ncbi:hypothetical protein H072_5289 [Dactylellina haptotyla CBS 200.50]|uniref:RING-type domain-containing protein n=1 Tax=Dactylellina haptotyla (strain CBS 200.50) TaxID=1284197 RepID=S8BN40_DACHA|nr:hypothetical protein H072_5289 [Dactylellina haptotyla CBS 200.50]
MAQSIADAVDQDASTIAEIVAVETTAARDREQVLRVENVTPRSTSTVPTDDTVCVYEDYETQASIPLHVLETPAFPEDYTYGSTQAGSSSQPQKKGAEYFAGPKVRCSSCLDHVLQTYNINCSSDHMYCRDCLRKYIFAAMKDETIYPLKCCRTEASHDAITAVLTPTEYQRYIDVGTEYGTANRLYSALVKRSSVTSAASSGSIAPAQYGRSVDCTMLPSSAWNGTRTRMKLSQRSSGIGVSS